MEQKIIKLRIANEYIMGAGGSVGTVGSHDDVLLEMDFRASEYWAGTTKRAIFSDALGENRTVIILTTNLLAQGQTETYFVPVPQEAKSVAGECFLTVEGFVTDASGNECIRCVTGEAKFRVLPSKLYINDNESVTPSQAEQLQSEIDDIKEDIAGAAAAADAKEVALAAAQAAQAAQAAAEQSAELLDDAADRLTALEDKQHSHGNKALLDGYAQTEEALADAVAQKHSHTNKEALDTITEVTQTLGNAEDKVPSEKAVSEAMAAGGALPGGGTAGQVLAKKTDAAMDVEWENVYSQRSVTVGSSSSVTAGWYKVGEVDISSADMTYNALLAVHDMPKIGSGLLNLNLRVANTAGTLEAAGSHMEWIAVSPDLDDVVFAIDASTSPAILYMKITETDRYFNIGVLSERYGDADAATTDEQKRLKLIRNYGPADTVTVATQITQTLTSKAMTTTFRFLGDNIISSTEDDTVPNWKALGNGWSGYSVADALNEQPNQYGILLSWESGNDLFQFWCNRVNGTLCFRCGTTHNNTGWRTTFNQGSVVMKYLTLNNGVNNVNVVTAFDDGDGTNLGSEITIGGGGNTFLGSGESHSGLQTLLSNGGATVANESYGRTGECTYICADSKIFLESNCQTVANRKVAVFDGNGAFIVPTNTDYTKSKTRNISAGTTDLTAGSSALENGAIYLVYE